MSMLINLKPFDQTTYLKRKDSKAADLDLCFLLYNDYKSLKDLESKIVPFVSSKNLVEPEISIIFLSDSDLQSVFFLELYESYQFIGMVFFASKVTARSARKLNEFRIFEKLFSFSPFKPLL